MYRIIKQLDGTIVCGGRVQDGTEHWTSPTLEEAIISMILFARTANHSEITATDILFLRECKQMVEQTYYTEWDVNLENKSNSAQPTTKSYSRQRRCEYCNTLIDDDWPAVYCSNRCANKDA